MDYAFYEVRKHSKSVVQRYQDIGAAIFRTDEDGAITLETDGRSVSIRTFTGSRLVSIHGS